MNAALFAISIAVGLTPEMLPMIVTTCLAKGAAAMSSKKVVIRNLNAIQNMGAMDILCTDKTGTLTRDKVVLEYHRNLAGQEDERVLRHAFLNSYYQTGLKNLMDIAIMEKAGELAGGNGSPEELEKEYTKTDEIPFDFERRRMSVVVTDKRGKTQMITKGADEVSKSAGGGRNAGNLCLCGLPGGNPSFDGAEKGRDLTAGRGVQCQGTPGDCCGTENESGTCRGFFRAG